MMGAVNEGLSIVLEAQQVRAGGVCEGGGGGDKRVNLRGREEHWHVISGRHSLFNLSLAPFVSLSPPET